MELVGTKVTKKTLRELALSYAKDHNEKLLDLQQQMNKLSAQKAAITNEVAGIKSQLLVFRNNLPNQHLVVELGDGNVLVWTAWQAEPVVIPLNG